jgi:hypothetical protein
MLRCAHVRRRAVAHVRLASHILCHALGIQELNQRKGGADLAWTARQLRAGAPVHRITREKDKWPAMANIVLSGPCEEGRGGALATHHGKARRIVTAGAHVHLRTSPTPSAVTSAWTWAYGDCAKGGLVRVFPLLLDGQRPSHLSDSLAPSSSCHPKPRTASRCGCRLSAERGGI